MAWFSWLIPRPVWSKHTSKACILQYCSSFPKPGNVSSSELKWFYLFLLDADPERNGCLSLLLCSFRPFLLGREGGGKQMSFHNSAHPENPQKNQAFGWMLTHQWYCAYSPAAASHGIRYTHVHEHIQKQVSNDTNCQILKWIIYGTRYMQKTHGLKRGRFNAFGLCRFLPVFPKLFNSKQCCGKRARGKLLSPLHCEVASHVCLSLGDALRKEHFSRSVPFLLTMDTKLALVICNEV